MPTDPTRPDRHLGRDTAATVALKPEWDRLVAAAPPHFEGAGEAAQVSPPIYRYCPCGYQNQWLGCCVGMGSANAVGTVLRIPEGCKFDPDDPAKSTPPLPTRRVSALFNYYNARNLHGRSEFKEGAVVAYAMDAVKARGVLPYEMWPDTQAYQENYADRRPPVPKDFQEAARHTVRGTARITSAAQVLDFLSQGYPVVYGIPVTDAWYETREDGFLDVGRGAAIGGHCTLLVGFDKRTNRVYVRNSWEKWGEHRPGDPDYADAGGWTNVGWAHLDQFVDTFLTPDNFNSGVVDAFVVSGKPGGFDDPTPLVTPASAVDLFI